MASAMCQAYPTFIRTTLQNLFLSLSQKDFIKNLLSPKNTVFLSIHHSAQCKIANLT